MDLEDVRNRLSALKYSQLRKAAKRYSVNANQKLDCTRFETNDFYNKSTIASQTMKEVLIMELSKVWRSECNKENIAPKKVTESEVALSCSLKSSPNDTLNQTFTIEQNYGNNVERCIENTIIPSEEPGGKTSVFQQSDKTSFLPSNASSFIPKAEQHTNTPCNGKSVAHNTLAARFAALHQKLAEKQPTLQEVDANVKRKFAEHEREVPETFKRLATPKTLKKANFGAEEVAPETIGYKFKNVNKDPSKIDFSFSKLYGTKNAFTTIQNHADIDSQSQIQPRRQRMAKIDVKGLAKKLNTKQVRRSPRLANLRHANSAALPQLSTRLQRLATPKGKNSEVSLTESEKKTLRRYGRRYVPYRRMIPYVDTTKMTDSQFQEAKMRGMIQTFTAISASRTETRQQLHMKRNKTREQILKTKRGC
ncbi:unnamed protein product [Litomosoides sigmodontis]|uniref:Uncharacterized protein n=1 Tax=Litomosoides sigmodontis TaxID=42156 RepID=A0A3P6SHF5_LITSI|nr:unnamed protein product [Litomosoides sigmodontis]